MEKTLTKQIIDCVERIFERGGVNLAKRIIVYPCGDVGIQVINILKNIYSVEPAYLIDNGRSKYAVKIHDISCLNNINTNDYILFLASTNINIYKELKSKALEYFTDENIVELEGMITFLKFDKYKTEIGKYSYGPICTNHQLIKSIGSFCSFAEGVDYVANHEMQYVTTHPIVYIGKFMEGYEHPAEDFQIADYYMSGIEPRAEKVKKQRRATIGNDVWLGRNVVITNSANIGNGVIAAAGAVITKDVPDYAIVAGVPARIMRYRYTPEQIKALNRIAWWDWTDDEIRARFDDFYLPIDEFVAKYDKTCENDEIKRS